MYVPNLFKLYFIHAIARNCFDKSFFWFFWFDIDSFFFNLLLHVLLQINSRKVYNKCNPTQFIIIQ